MGLMMIFLTVYFLCCFVDCEYYVALNGTLDNDCGTEGNECKTIEILVQGRNESMTVIIHPGTYFEVCNFII
jgi:hypothetical protein